MGNEVPLIGAVHEDPAGRNGPAEGIPGARWLLVTVALMSAAAGAIHFAVVPEHLSEYRPFGSFFIALGIAQVLWAMALLGSFGNDRRLLMAGAVASSLVVALWLAARITGLPVGSEAWTPESFGFPDTLSAVFEFGVAIGVALLVAGVRIPIYRAAMPILAAALVIFGTTAAALNTLGGEEMAMGAGSGGDPARVAGGAPTGAPHAMAKMSPEAMANMPGAPRSDGPGGDTEAGDPATPDTTTGQPVAAAGGPASSDRTTGQPVAAAGGPASSDRTTGQPAPAVAGAPEASIPARAPASVLARTGPGARRLALAAAALFVFGGFAVMIGQPPRALRARPVSAPSGEVGR